ncbi:hypothetical protein LGQ02_09445 [Bacillus shivajii]|uniref:DUF6933 domain-containing protein n=1 Tax=Bacillus shivajii TaxID=1983719 RepID=UPI001CFB83F3|nr:hypothetical protein [Bacillus shivajii]UCZ54945.1 hypothetical protein LGQ02_09445 [Bacillus shivajii]
MVNDKNRYTIVLYGLKAKDYKNLEELFIEGVKQAFKEEGIKAEMIDKYVQHSKQFFYGKTKNRTTVARVNQICKEIEFFIDRLDLNTIIQTPLSVFTSQLLRGDGKGDYIYPYKEMYKDLENFC